MGIATAAVGEGVVPGDEEELIVHDYHGTPGLAEWQSVLDAGAKSKASRSRPVIGKASLDERAEYRLPRTSGRAHGEVELQPVFVSDGGIPRKALVTINRYQREPWPDTKSHAALDEVLI